MEKFNPTMIIGLGGMGCKVVEGIYRKFKAGNPSELDEANVAFLCLDTDENDIKARLKIMPSSSVVKTSSDLSASVGQYIEQIKYKTSVEKWFDTNSFELNTMALNDGAAQVRMASRLAMISAIDEGKLSSIDNSITQLMSTNPDRKKGNNIRIHIVTSLAGGTGAGTFLQMAYYVKNAMREHGASAPKINGYFMLADVLCNDPSNGFDNSQKENTRSNTYACLKELAAFSRKKDEKASILKEMEFEYKLGQRDKSIPTDPPYDTCFIMDFNGADGGNLQLSRRYEAQMVSYIFLNAFSNVGDDYRKKAINDIRTKIEANGAKRYSSIGVSKLVYPVDDLFAYFACQSVTDNMANAWCKIDKDIQQRYDEYKKNISEGIPDTWDGKGKMFKQNVESQAKTGAGSLGAQFKQIYNSTQVLNKDMIPEVSKASKYVEAVKQFVEDSVNGSVELNALYGECSTPNPNFTRNDNVENDLGFVARRERELEEYRKAVMRFIDNTKRYMVRQCFMVDHESEGFVSKTPLAHQYHLNSFILEKGNEMHPLAVRYFLYDVVEELTKNLFGEEGLKGSNMLLRAKIEKGYQEAFDVAETKDRRESAQDNLRRAKQKNSGIGSSFSNLISGQNPYKAAKENYETKSKQQGEDIKTYATNKLLEDTFSGLLEQINLLIEESERFFDHLPNALAELENERIVLLKKHNIDNSDPSVKYVLASEQIKKDIYELKISRNASPFFPSEMAASVYCTMFDQVYNALSTEGFATTKKVDPKERRKAIIEANKRIINDCISFQKDNLRESNPDYANKNVIAALKEEAMRECDNDVKRAHLYMLDKFASFRDSAEIWGPNSLGTDVRFINAWGMHPDCIDLSTISVNEADELFGDTDVKTNPKTAASRLVSEYFDPCEIVRANTVTLLAIDEHFSKLLVKAPTKLTGESIGDYYMSYQDVINKMHKPNSNTFTPHLDKYWHLPAYMPYIGSTMEDERKKLFQALFGGLLFERFKAVYEGGEYYWKYKGKTLQFIKDIDGRRVTIGQSQESALNNLFEKGLVNNPTIVEQINEYVEEKWEEARDNWLGAERDETNELMKMKESDIIKLIVDFRFNIHSSFKKNQNWFTLLNSRQGLALHKTICDQKNCFFEDLLNHLIAIFGPSVNTQRLCKFVLGKAGSRLKDDAENILEQFVDEGRFEPKD